MANEIKGRVYRIGEVENVSQSFSKQTLAIVQQRYDPETGEPYKPNYAEIEFVKNNIRLLQGLHEGDKVVVKFVVEGRLYKADDKPEMIFTRLKGVGLEKQEARAEVQEPRAESQEAAPVQVDPLMPGAQEQRLPWE